MARSRRYLLAHRGARKLAPAAGVISCRTPYYLLLNYFLRLARPILVLPSRDSAEPRITGAGGKKREPENPSVSESSSTRLFSGFWQAAPDIDDVVDCGHRQL